MHKLLIISALLLSSALCSCSETPAELAQESIRLHEELARCTNADDSAAVFKKIIAIESQARDKFNKQELKEYERLAHPQ